jgi:YHS domain-containing protein
MTPLKKISTLVLLLFAGLAQAGESPLLNLEAGVGIHGYDPVAYFGKSGPVEGKKDFTAKGTDGATYHFVSAENRDAFVKEPARYQPEYGGWCAYAIGANDDFVDVDPKTFKIVNGKLLLFYNGFYGNTLKKWNKAESELAPKAVANWKIEQAKRGVK